MEVILYLVFSVCSKIGIQEFAIGSHIGSTRICIYYVYA